MHRLDDRRIAGCSERHFTAATTTAAAADVSIVAGAAWLRIVLSSDVVLNGCCFSHWVWELRETGVVFFRLVG